MSNFVSGLIADAMGQRGQLPASLETFVAEIACELGPELAAGFRRAFRAIDLEGDGNVHAGGFIEAVTWIASRRDRPLWSRLEMIHRFRHAARGEPIDMQLFTGWV